MTRFTFKGDVTWGSGSDARSFSVMAENQQGFNAYASKAGDAVADGVALLENAVAALSRDKVSSEVAKYANRYFLTGKTLDKSDIDTIKIFLNKTLLGMRGGTMGVKVKKSDPGAHGEVLGVTGGDHTKSYHNSVIDLDDGEMTRQGAIHITGDRLGQKRLGVKTMIHEATHKFAGTTDYCYFNDSGDKPRSEFNSKAKALQNADSFAWFALKVGRGSGTFKSKMYS